jgi:hypothetical protein
VSDPYRIAESSVVLRFAGSALRRRLAPAFSHLAVPPVSPASVALTVNLWDSASTNAPPPPRPTTPGDHAPGALFYIDEPPVRAVYQPGLEALSVFDERAGRAWHWVRDAAEVPYWDRASPIRQILFWWLRTRGYLQVHGGAVGTADGGVLLVGKSGSGKSTVALSALDSQLLFAADDYVAVTVDSFPRVASLYGSAKLEPEHARDFLPHLVPLLANRSRLDKEKAVVYVNQQPSRMTQGFPLRAIVVPMVRLTQAGSRVVDISKSVAFAALAPSTIVQLHTAGQDSFEAMSRLVERVPCFGLEVGTDIAAIPGTVAALLARLKS